ncbi:hypothetical protein [Bordetella pertussis]|uniref:hypothetical protein n=1 Tax=Bordetella pertussis TaxID=520 RepID=UPI003990868E
MLVQRARVGVGVLAHQAALAGRMASAEVGQRAGARLRRRGTSRQLPAGRVHPQRPAARQRHDRVERLPGPAGGQADLGGLLQARGAQGLRRAQPHLRGIEPGQVRQALGRRQIGIADIHHHHAGGEPEHEQQAQAHAHPAMQQIQPALGAQD